MDEKKDITTDIPPEQIEADIARTRREITGTVGAIRERISPGHLKGQAKYKVRESTVGRAKEAASRISRRAKETGTQIADTVRRDPVPLALVGVGMAWWMINRSRHNGSRISERTAALRNKTGELSGKVQEKAGEFTRQARERSGALAEKAKYAAGRYRRVAQDKALDAKNIFQQTAHDNPFTITAAAFALGAVFGLIIPETGREQEVMGSASGTVLGKARETAQETLHKAQHAAEKAIETAKEEFK